MRRKIREPLKDKGCKDYIKATFVCNDVCVCGCGWVWVWVVVVVVVSVFKTRVFQWPEPCQIGETD